MPHKPTTSRNVTVQFVSVSLTVELRARLTEWRKANEENLIALMVEAVQAGYRVTIKEEDQGYAASMATTRSSGPNTGLILMERAATPDRALLRLLWAHTDHYRLVWPKEAQLLDDNW